MQNESLTLRVTPAGKLFMRFISTLNTNDPEKIKHFITNYYDPALIDQEDMEITVGKYLALYDITGGLDIFKVYLSEEHFIIVITQARLDGKMYMDKLKVEPRAKAYLITEYYHETTISRQ